MNIQSDLKQGLAELHDEIVDALAQPNIPTTTRQRLRTLASRIPRLMKTVDEIPRSNWRFLLPIMKVVLALLPFLKIAKHTDSSD